MAVTLEQAKVSLQDKLSPLVIDEFRKSSFLLDRIPFDDCVAQPGGGSTMTYSYTRVITQPTAEFRELNKEYTPQEAAKERHSVDLKIFGGAFQIDRVIADLGGAANEVSFQMAQKVKAASALFTDTVINGDSDTDSKAFDGLEKIIEDRVGKRSMGFENAVQSKKERHTGELFQQVQPHDLLKFGIIPELVGRLPVIAALDGLNREDLVRILTEPKNALVKQYQKLLALDEVKLDFDDGALTAIAEKAMKKDTGARALRAIIEEFMLDIMYEIPKDDSIGQVTITREYIEGTGGPIIQLRGQEVPRLS